MQLSEYFELNVSAFLTKNLKNDLEIIGTPVKAVECISLYKTILVLRMW
jgi:hypothetical protein